MLKFLGRFCLLMFVLKIFAENDLENYLENEFWCRNIDQIEVDDEYMWQVIKANFDSWAAETAFSSSVNTRIPFDEVEYRKQVASYNMFELMKSLCTNETNIKNDIQVKSEDEEGLFEEQEYFKTMLEVHKLDVEKLEALKDIWWRAFSVETVPDISNEVMRELLKYSHMKRRVAMYEAGCAAMDRYIEIARVQLRIDQEMIDKMSKDLADNSLNDLFLCVTTKQHQIVIDHYQKTKDQLMIRGKELTAQIEEKNSILSVVDYILQWREATADRFMLVTQLHLVRFREKVIDIIMSKIEELKTEGSL